MPLEGYLAPLLSYVLPFQDGDNFWNLYAYYRKTIIAKFQVQKSKNLVKSWIIHAEKLFQRH